MVLLPPGTLKDHPFPPLSGNFATGEGRGRPLLALTHTPRLPASPPPETSLPRGPALGREGAAAGSLVPCLHPLHSPASPLPPSVSGPKPVEGGWRMSELVPPRSPRDRKRTGACGVCLGRPPDATPTPPRRACPLPSAGWAGAEGNPSVWAAPEGLPLSPTHTSGTVPLSSVLGDLHPHSLLGKLRLEERRGQERACLHGLSGAARRPSSGWFGWSPDPSGEMENYKI